MLEKTFRISGGIDKRELAFKALAGFAGGAAGWLPVELAMIGHSFEHPPTGLARLTLVGTMGILSGSIGGLINAAELQTFEFTRAVKIRLITGFVICFLLGLVSFSLSDKAFNAILHLAGWQPTQQIAEFYLVLARVVGWVLMGAMLGAGVGLAGFSLKAPGKTLQNVLKGAAGGWVGGFIGGLSFDLVSAISGGGLVPRLVGFCLIGLLIGLSIGLVQELTKVAWLAVEAGRLRGRQYRLEGATVMIGRAEENPVGLFGDPGVQPRHAVIERRSEGYVLKNLAVQAGTLVNGARAESVELHDSDVIKISNYELSFHLRTGSSGERSAAPAAVRSAPSPAAPVATPATAPANASAWLVNSTGERFGVRSGVSTQIGRALDNDIVVNDSSVSRHHATIQSNNGTFTMRDLGSQNGTFVAGEKINEKALKDGDSLKLGDAVFTFHG
jgi:pSer/pThr/pTyr-binding forkhead associated (FHA) protein